MLLHKRIAKMHFRQREPQRHKGSAVTRGFLLRQRAKLVVSLSLVITPCVAG